MELPLVSCIIPTYKRPHLVIDAIESVLEDPYPNIEVIVVDDGSSEKDLEILNKTFCKKNNVRIISNNFEKGGSGARNFGIEKANGKYITFLDDDDLNIKGKIAAQVKLALENDAELVTCTRCIYETEHGKRVRGRVFQKVTLSNMWGRNEIVSVSPLVSSSLMKKVLFDPNLPSAQDYDVWIRCLQENPITVNYSEPAIRYRKIDRNSITRNRRKKIYGRYLFFAKHKKLMPLTSQFRFLCITLIKWIIPDPKYYFYYFIQKICRRRF